MIRHLLLKKNQSGKYLLKCESVITTGTVVIDLHHNITPRSKSPPLCFCIYIFIHSVNNFRLKRGVKLCLGAMPQRSMEKLLQRWPLPPGSSECLGAPARQGFSLQFKCHGWNYITCHGNSVGGSRALLFDEFLHVQPYLSITYSLYLWEGWMALFYPTPRIFQELQKDSGWSGQACVQGEVGLQPRGRQACP